MIAKSSLKAILFAFVFVGGGATALATNSATGGGAVGPLGGSAAQAGPARHAQAVPAALRPALYQALGNDAGMAYDVNTKGCATLSKSSLKACFDGHGAHFTGKAASLSLHLIAFGRDQALSQVKAVHPVIRGNWVSYAHGNLTEWWRVLPVGFEQGFTIAKRPAGDGELKLALATGRQNTGAPEDGTLAWGHLRYGDLVVTDANGKVIPATLKTKGNHVLIAVNDAHAVYPVTVDPLVWLEQKVSASDGAANDYFGISVALQGTTAMIGADASGTGQGAVYVFANANGTWTQVAKLTDGVEGDLFGGSVAFNGRTALVGADLTTVNGNYGQGAVYVFAGSGGTWTQTAKLTASDGAGNDFFGISVALDGTNALIGAYDATVGGNWFQGKAYVFTGSNGAWTQAALLTSNDGSMQGEFGYSVAISGTTALVGAPGQTVNGNSFEGAAYVFSESDGSWTQTAELAGNDLTAFVGFGTSVALDGTTALIGASGATVNGNSGQGAAYIFSESNGTWIQSQELTASDGQAGDFFGIAVALNGGDALIGASQCVFFPPSCNNGGLGAAYVFSETDGTWTQMQKLTANDAVSGDWFGGYTASVGIDGTTALVGAYEATVNGNSAQGAAYFYGESDLGLNVSAPQTVGQGQNYVSQTIATNNGSAASPAVTATVTVPAAASFVSATASQGSCSEDSGVVSCDFGQINGNAGTATANVTLKATGNVGDTIDNAAGIAKATPPLSASAPTTITAGSACPDGYSEYDGSLNAGQRTHSPIYHAPAGMENAVLTGPSGFQLYAVFQNARVGRKVYRIPGNEVHRRTPAGYFTWVVNAGDTGGAYTLCVQHP